MTQSEALDILKLGHSVFLTGGAGAGKTYVLNQYIAYLRRHGITPAITASTGIAATHIGGTTIHSWSGLGIKDSISDFDLEMMESKKQLWDRYSTARVVIIDEISMLSGKFLDMFDRVCRYMKRVDAPFGGMQIIMCGDLFQLPPITRAEQLESLAMDSGAWDTLKPVVCYITEQHRQSDLDFLDILESMRSNTFGDIHMQMLMDRSVDYDHESFRSTTKLFSHNAMVDRVNSDELEMLEGDPVIYTMKSKGKEHLVEILKKGCLAPENLPLKIDTEVMFVKNNFEKGYVNGTRGRVIDFTDDELPIVELSDGTEITVEPVDWSIDSDDGVTLAGITQLPLRHAWAITIHKSQGMSLDTAVIDLSQSFVPGMGYVALSRVRSLSGLHLVGFSDNALVMHPRIQAFDAKLRKLSDAAAARISQLQPSEISQRHEAFLLRAGGSVSEIDPAELAKPKIPREPSWKSSSQKFLSGMSINEIATESGFTRGTIIEHLAKAYDNLVEIPVARIEKEISKKAAKQIYAGFIQLPHDEERVLTWIKDFTEAEYDANYSFDEIKLGILWGRLGGGKKK